MLIQALIPSCFVPPYGLITDLFRAVAAVYLTRSVRLRWSLLHRLKR
jgi:hypothetical protein